MNIRPTPIPALSMASKLCDSGFDPKDFLGNYTTLREAGFTSDDIMAHYDLAKMFATEQIEAEIARDLEEMAEAPHKALATLTAAIKQALYLTRFPYQEDRIAAVLSQALAEVEQ